jgi:adenylate cyclase
MNGRVWRRRRPALLAGLTVAAAGLMVSLADPGGMATRWREAAFDRLETQFPRPATATAVAVVDIDRVALDRAGPWPWPRQTLAELVATVAAHKPSVIALDMLLGERRGEPAEARAQDGGDSRLAEALRQVPSVLGFVLDPDAATGAPEGAPLVVDGPLALPGLMAAPGAAVPAAVLRAAARGIGVISLAAPEGAPVRGVPLLAAAGPSIVTGLALEAVRAAVGDVTLIAGGDPPVIRAGPIAPRLAADAGLRLHFTKAGHRAMRTLSAAALLAGSADGATLSGKIVFIGASAPEAGGLRETATDPFMPSVQIQAEAAEQLLVGSQPERPDWALGLEGSAAMLLAAGAIVAAILLPPGLAMVVVAALAALWLCGVVAAFVKASLLLDPLAPPVIAVLAFQATALAGFALARQERLAIERRFSQHLPPEVVRRIADNPASLRLEGEERIITALFTDIEGFTALTERVGPRELIRLLDRYFECVCGLVVEHGGMVDKLVGDAVHALFNAPVDLANHAERAIACALAIRDATEALRRDPLGAQLGLGRTRIGIETGRAVLGDVGGGRKLDYTAHGDAINTAAKLEAANKVLGTSIAVGPGTVAACPGRRFRAVGSIKPSPASQSITVSEPLGEGDDHDAPLGA